MIPEALVFFILFASLAAFAATIYAVWEIATKSFKQKDQKVIWVIVVLGLGLIGTLIYFAKREDLLAGPEEEADREYLPPLKEERLKEPLSRTGFDDDQYV